MPHQEAPPCWTHATAMFHARSAMLQARRARGLIPLALPSIGRLREASFAAGPKRKASLASLSSMRPEHAPPLLPSEMGGRMTVEDDFGHD